jgi:ABC-type bacteriocin/lantibiotic exporter with double-glycine peptidase domain
VVLQDPNAGDDALLMVDRVRFENAWTGEVILVRRDYDVREESQPFSIGFVRGLILRERRMVRDIAICAVVLGFLSLMPIVFWQVLISRVLLQGLQHILRRVRGDARADAFRSCVFLHQALSHYSPGVTAGLEAEHLLV